MTLRIKFRSKLSALENGEKLYKVDAGGTIVQQGIEEEQR